jgi:thiamine biosynthesis lipoprotein
MTMKKLNNVTIALAIVASWAAIALLIVPTWAKPPMVITHLRGVEMTISYNIKIGKLLSEEERILCQSVIESTFQEINETLNNWNPRSEIAKLNNAPSNTKVSVSPHLYLAFMEAKRVHQLTNGLFDPAYSPLIMLWKSSLTRGTIPSQNSIQETSKQCGLHLFTIKNGHITKKSPYAYLDFCGLSKGYAVDLLAEKLKQAGFSSALVEWGGEVKAIGTHPSGRKWTVYIPRFDDASPESAITRFSLEDGEAAATSGDYNQIYPITQGNSTLLYTHIIDPFKKAPLSVNESSLRSITVKAKSCMIADMVATVLMLAEDKKSARQLLMNLRMEYPHLQSWSYYSDRIHDPISLRTK